MHMADALISPAVGASMWVISAGLIGFCSKKIRAMQHDHTIPLMGVLGAFIFAAQMINFTIPGTGSSGHLGGGMLLAILLGPYAGFITMASVLTIQALFFADGGLLALGCNMFNLGFFPCFIAYPLIFKQIIRNEPSWGRLAFGATLASIIGLQLGAFCVVLETVFSGVSSLPLKTFLLLIQPIHLAIGLIEGLATTAVVSFVWKARPELLKASDRTCEYPVKASIRPIWVTLLVCTLIMGGVACWFASSHPDGLEWAIKKVTGTPELETQDSPVYALTARIQEKTAFLPDYGFDTAEGEENIEAESTWPVVDSGTSLAGLVGGTLTLLMAIGAGLLLKAGKTMFVSANSLS